GGTDHQAMRVSITFDFFRSHDDGIDTYLTGQMAVDRGRDPVAVKLPPLDDQQVQVAVRPHRAARRRSEQNDLLRVGCLHDPLDARLELVRLYIERRLEDAEQASLDLPQHRLADARQIERIRMAGARELQGAINVVEQRVDHRDERQVGELLVDKVAVEPA